MELDNNEDENENYNEYKPSEKIKNDEYNDD